MTCRTWRKPHFFLIEFQVLMKSPLFWTKKNHPPQRNLTLQDGSLVPNRFPLRLKHFSFRRGDGNPILKWWEHTDSDASFNIWNFHVYLYIYIYGNYGLKLINKDVGVIKQKTGQSIICLPMIFPFHYPFIRDFRSPRLRTPHLANDQIR